MAITNRLFLIFGVVAAAIFLGNVIVLGALTPGYDHVSQTISELGESGTPLASAFRNLELLTSASLILFSCGVFRFAVERGYSVLPALLLGFLGAATIGIAFFETAHPLHNIFGISSTVGFLAPLALAVTWPSEARLSVLRRISAAIGALLLVALALNLSPVFIEFAPSDFIRSHYGAIQRLLFVPFYAWSVYLAVVLTRQERHA